MQTIEFLKGLPASGKSSYAKEKVAKHPNQWKRVNKDDLRAMIDASHHSKGNEKLIKQVQEDMVRTFLKAGKHVIIDDTNFYHEHEERFRALAKEFGASFKVKFFDLDVEECVKRDSERANRVGAKVIRSMYNQYFAPKPHERTKYMEQDPLLDPVVVVDIDGCVALINPENPRLPYDMTRVEEDIVNVPVADLVKTLYASNHDIIFVSGRTGTDQCRQDTFNWIMGNLNFDGGEIMLFMRKEGDYRKDYIIKREIYENEILPFYRIKYVIGDRKQVVDAIRAMGLPVFQVAEGNF